MKKILISGGAGFIGSSLALKLLEQGRSVRILDNLSPQIHGTDSNASFLFARVKPHVEFIKGDVRFKEDWIKALDGCDAVIHLAAETGTGQSMYRICHYTEVNVQGTARLMELLAEAPGLVRKVVIASSRAVYGEGRYLCNVHGVVYPAGRSEQDMLDGQFEPRCPFCSEFASMQPTDETSPARPTSLYGVTKLTQEQIVMIMGAALKIPCVGFRFQNVYGPGQSLHNPYTGILAIFTTLLRKGLNINIFEDGLESRDFVYIDDVVSSILLGLDETRGDGQVFNIGTGVQVSVKEIAYYLKELIGSGSDIFVSGNFRIGDIRHNVADLGLARSILGYEPLVEYREGMRRYVDWVLTQEIPESRYEESLDEMKKKGMFKSSLEKGR